MHARSCLWLSNQIIKGKDIGIAVVIELIVSIIGLIAVWFMTSSTSDSVVVCLVVLIVIGVVKLFRNKK